MIDEKVKTSSENVALQVDSNQNLDEKNMSKNSRAAK